MSVLNMYIIVNLGDQTCETLGSKETFYCEVILSILYINTVVKLTNLNYSVIQGLSHIDGCSTVRRSPSRM